MELDAAQDEGDGVRGLIIRPDDEVIAVVLSTLTDFTAALDGAWREYVPLVNGTMYVDSGVIQKGWDADATHINYIASALASTIGYFQLDHWLLGPVVVVGPYDQGGWDTHITPVVGRLIRQIEMAFQ